MPLYGAFFMIKNFVVSGCSFTQTITDGWTLPILREYGPFGHINLAKSAAGNYYISNSIIDCLLTTELVPEETLVIVMWSGVSRLDNRVSTEYYNRVSYTHKTNSYRQNYIFSGGRLGTWNTDMMVKPLFHNQYITLDEQALGRSTLVNILNTENFLKTKGYNYKFMSYVNYWEDTPDPVADMDFNIPYYCKNDSLLTYIDFSNWIFADSNKNCLYEYAKNATLLDSDNFHPSERGYAQFATDIVIPNIRNFFK